MRVRVIEYASFCHFLLDLELFRQIHTMFTSGNFQTDTHYVYVWKFKSIVLVILKLTYFFFIFGLPSH